MWMLLFAMLTHAAPPLEIGVDPVAVPAAVEVPADTLVWVDVTHPDGAPAAVAEVLGDDLANCPKIASTMGFRPRGLHDLWASGVLGRALVEVTAAGVRVGGDTLVSLENGAVPERFKEGVVIRPLLDRLLAHREALYQFRVACDDPPWKMGGPATAASREHLLLAVAPDVPFDVVHEVLVSARKARFKHFYLYARGRTVRPDPLAAPPDLGDASTRVFVASDGGLGIDYEQEGTDSPRALLGYLPAASGDDSARVVPYLVSPFADVVGAAGALLAHGYAPALLPRLDREDLRTGRSQPRPRRARHLIPANRTVQAVPITLPEGSAEQRRRVGNVTRFSIAGATPHVAIFTPPAHLADALNTPEVGARLKHILTCYRDEESDEEGLKGGIDLEVHVRPTGAPDTVKVLPTSELEDPHLRRCVVDEFTALRFPQAAITPDPMLWRIQFLPKPPGQATTAGEE